MYQESASSTQADATNPSSTQVPRGDVWNCANSNGMASSLGNESRPPMRSPHDTGAHAIPTTPRITKITGSAPGRERNEPQADEDGGRRRRPRQRHRDRDRERIGQRGTQ